MGLSSKKTKTSSTSTGTATTTPQVPDFIRGPASNYYGQVGNLLNSGTPAGTPASSLQNQAFSGASNLSLNPAIMQAMNGTRGLMNFSPDSVTAGQLRDTDLSPYMNPYTQNVIDTTAADMERARQGAISQGQGRATMSGAYGGARHGVADAETNSGFFRDLGGIIANLRNTGFQNAQGAALTDIGNRLSADTGNADRGVTGAGVRLAAANQLGNQGQAAGDATRQNIALQAGLGGQQRDIAQQNDPNQVRIQQLAQIARLLGIDPGDFIGQQINQSGSSSGSSTQSGGLSMGWGPDGFSFGFG